MNIWKSAIPYTLVFFSFGVVAQTTEPVVSNPPFITSVLMLLESEEPVTPLEGVMSISSGNQFTCAVIDSGEVYCWGANHRGQLGNGTYIEGSTPTAVQNIDNAIAVASGWDHSCALLQTETIMCWGGNEEGQLGNNSTIDSNLPVSVVNVSTAVSIDTSFRHTCANLSDDTVTCWGLNASSQLGNGEIENGLIPVEVEGIDSAFDVSVGRDFSCARLSDGTIRCWGGNSFGTLGNGNNSDSQTPVQVSAISTANQIDSGRFHTCTTLDDLSIRCWGANLEGRLGNGTTSTSSNTPLTVSGSHQFSMLSSGGQHSCSILDNSSVMCWGDNDFGELGDGSLSVGGAPNFSSIPVAVLMLPTATFISAGDGHSCAVMPDSTARCWGKNANGQLGNGQQSAAVAAPTLVIGPIR